MDEACSVFFKSVFWREYIIITNDRIDSSDCDSASRKYALPRVRVKNVITYVISGFCGNSNSFRVRRRRHVVVFARCRQGHVNRHVQGTTRTFAHHIMYARTIRMLPTDQSVFFFRIYRILISSCRFETARRNFRNRRGDRTGIAISFVDNIIRRFSRVCTARLNSSDEIDLSAPPPPTETGVPGKQNCSNDKRLKRIWIIRKKTGPSSPEDSKESLCPLQTY